MTQTQVENTRRVKELVMFENGRGFALCQDIGALHTYVTAIKKNAGAEESGVQMIDRGKFTLKEQAIEFFDQTITNYLKKTRVEVRFEYEYGNSEFRTA
jgi:hypothetical protein